MNYKPINHQPNIQLDAPSNNLEQMLHEIKTYHKVLLVYMALSLPAIPVLGYFLEQLETTDYTEIYKIMLP